MHVCTYAACTEYVCIHRKEVKNLCWVRIPRFLARFSAWTPSYWCHMARPRRRIPVFRPCVVEPLRFLQSVSVFRTLAARTLRNSSAGASMRWLSSRCRRTTSRLLVYPHSFTRVHTSKRSAPRHCALQICCIARNFAHQTNMYVIWTAALLNLGFSASSAQHLAPSIHHCNYQGPQIFNLRVFIKEFESNLSKRSKKH